MKTCALPIVVPVIVVQLIDDPRNVMTVVAPARSSTPYVPAEAREFGTPDQRLTVIGLVTRVAPTFTASTARPVPVPFVDPLAPVATSFSVCEPAASPARVRPTW